LTMQAVEALSGEHVFEIIPVELYNKVTRETVEICRGYMFEKLRHWLDANGYCWYRTHISGRIQEIVEQNFMLYTMRLGVPEAYLKYTKYPFHFHKLLRWVFADYNNRISLCKTGWQSWAKYEGIQREVHDDVMKYSGKAVE